EDVVRAVIVERDAGAAGELEHVHERRRVRLSGEMSPPDAVGHALGLLPLDGRRLDDQEILVRFFPGPFLRGERRKDGDDGEDRRDGDHFHTAPQRTSNWTQPRRWGGFLLKSRI